MGEAGLVERVAHRADPSVHHVGGGNDVAAGFGLEDRLAAQERHGLVVLDIAGSDHPVMAMRGERVERHVAQHAKSGQGLFQSRDRTADQIAGVERLAAFFILERGGHRREHRNRRNAESSGFSGGVDKGRDRQAKDTGHRRDRRLMAFVMDKDRPNQIARCQYTLGDELARPSIAAVAPQPEARVGGERRQKLGHRSPRKEQRMPAK